MKLKSFYKDNIYIITQSPHCGSAQDCKAMDFGFLGYGDRNLYAPCDMTFKRSWNDGVEYWVDNCEGVYIQFVHIKPIDQAKKKQGDKFGTPINDHGHIALYDKKWDLYLNYCDRSAKLYWWQFGGQHDKWTNWSTYSDLQFSCYNNSMQKVDELPNLLKLTATNTATFNIRLEASSSSQDLGDVPIGHVWYSNHVAYGESVNGNNKWYEIRVPNGAFEGQIGFCSAVWVKEEVVQSDCSAQEAEIEKLNQEIKKVNYDLAVQKTKVLNFKDEVTKAIDSYNSL